MASLITLGLETIHKKIGVKKKIHLGPNTGRPPAARKENSILNFATEDNEQYNYSLMSPEKFLRFNGSDNL